VEQVLLDQQGRLDQVGVEVHLVRMASLVTQVLLDSQGNQVLKVNLDLLGLLDQQEVQGLLGSQGLQASLDPRDLLVTLDLLVVMDGQDQRALLEK
jgi:NAD(P)H-nitrite reductase large subunit